MSRGDRRTQPMEFRERTIRIVIDERRCEGCQTYACVDACRKFNRAILGLKEGRPTVLIAQDELKRLGTECLACEFACLQRGNGAITIEVPVEGLDDYRRRHGTDR